MNPRDDVLKVAAIYNPNDEFPYVSLEWGPMQGTLTADEARHFALRILACATDTEQNAFLVDFLVQKLGHPADKVGALLQEFRDWREKRGPEN